MSSDWRSRASAEEVLTPEDRDRMAFLDDAILRLKTHTRLHQEERRRILNRGYQKKHQLSKKVLDCPKEKA